MALLYYGRAFFITIVIASMIAFLLDPIVLLAMRLRLPRSLASFVVCFVGVALLYLAGVGLYTEALQISDDLPAYGARINQLVDAVATRMDRVESAVYLSLLPKRFQDNVTTAPPDLSKGKRRKAGTPAVPPDPPPQPTVQEVHVQQDPTPLIRYVYEYARDYYSTLLMASFVPFLVYFLLSWRDHIRNRYLLLFEGDARRSAEDAWMGIGMMVRAYVIGNFMLGILLTISSALLFASVNVPYWLVVAPISGFFSLVPYIGLPLAMLPPVIAALPTAHPGTYVFLLVSVTVLHLLALNLMYPKLVGARVHLNPLVVTIALMFWGMMWGGIGLLLAIPLTAALKAVCDHVANLRPYGRLLGD